MEKKKILIVEDEILIAEDIQVSLIKYNYAIVGIVSSGESALEKCREIQPDLILMDIVIQGELSGIETAAKIRELYDIPVIYLTAYADEKTLQTAKITEPFGYIIKPYEDRELFATIEMAFYRFKSEKEIKRSYQYNQNIINSSLDMIISTDKDMKIVGFNKAAEDTFGYRFSEIEGKDYKILFANEADYFFVYEDTIHKEKSTFEVFNSRSNGEEFECFLSASVLRDERGSIDGIMSISREITAMKKSEEILRELKEAVETLRLGVTITDIQGNITYTNPADAEIHGYKVAELIGKDARIFAPLTYRKTTSIDQIKKWKGLIRESTNIRKDGSKFPVWLISNVVKDKDGNPTAIVTTCEDITDRKEMEKQLLRSERLAGIGELAAGIAHEIRNPLGNISSSAQFCIRKYNPAKEIKQYLEIIRRNSDNANKIIKELLDFANPREIALKKIHIGEIIDSVIKLVEARSRSHKVYIKPEYLSDIPLIDLDEKWIEQAFLNFVLNSIDAMPNGGELKISVQTKKDKGILEIIFADTGMGISEAKLKKVFDPFFTTKDDGVGLGLSLVHQIIMAHKGKIRIKSEIDKGTQIFVTLPISEG